MAKLGEEAKAYEPPKTKNIADLEVVRVDAEMEEKEFTKKDEEGKEETFTVNVIVVNNEEYRVPNSVLKSLKAILEKKPELKTFQVAKTGEGFKTEYTVIPLE